MKKCSLLFIAAAGAVALSGCNNPDAETPANLYQQYEVLIDNNGMSAFANMRRGGADGERVRIADEALTVNMLPMYYDAPVSATDPEFTYFATLPFNHTEAIFRFRNSNGETLVNSVDLESIPEVTPIDESIYELHAGERVEVLLNGAPINEVKGWLVGSSALSTPVFLTVTPGIDIDADRAEIVMPTVTPGVYNFVLEVDRAQPVTDGDGTAGGIINVIKRHRTNVKF